MKKFISILTAAALTAGLAAFAAGCGGSEEADLAKGMLSQEGYASLTEAATACVTEEIAGDATAATYKSYAAERLLEQKEIDSLNIPADKKAKLTRAEEGTITYSAPDADGNAKDFTMDIVLLNFGDEVSYYILDPADGENLTKSYYDRVNTVDFDNFTWSMTVEQTTAMGGVTVNQDLSFDIKYTGTALWFKMVMPDVITADKQQTMELYAANADGKIVTYLSQNGSEFMVNTTTDYTSLEELLDESMVQAESTSQFDHSYYVKTDFGFSVKEDKVTQLLDKMFSSMQLGADIDVDELSFDFYVTDGIVTSSVFNCDISATVSGQTVSVSMDMKLDVTDIGTTTITLPQVDTDQTA